MNILKIKKKIDSLIIFDIISIHLYIKHNLKIQKVNSKKINSNYFNLFLINDTNYISLFAVVLLSLKLRIFIPNALIFILSANFPKAGISNKATISGRLIRRIFQNIKFIEESDDLPNLPDYPNRFGSNSISFKLFTSDYISIRSILFARQSLRNYEEFSIHYFDTYRKNWRLNAISQVFTKNIRENILSNSIPYQCIITNPLEKLSFLDFYLFLVNDYSTILKVFFENPSIHLPYFLIKTKKNSPGNFYLDEITKKQASNYLQEYEKIHSEFIDGRISDSIHIKRTIVKNILVSIIIPFKDNAKLTLQCVESIQNNSDFINYEIILVNNGSSEQETDITCKYLLSKYKNVSLQKFPSIFNFSAINNFAVKKAKGNFLLFLNNDIFAIRPDWLYELVQHAQRPKVGAVGPLLLYPDKSIQHAGVVMGLGGVAGHIGNSVAFEEFKTIPRFVLEQNVTAVTGACLMVQKTKFEEVGGMDESFPVAYNDVDLCLKLKNRGYENVYNPYSVLIHYESKSRGSDQTEVNFFRYQMDMNRFLLKWGDESVWNDDCFSNHYTRFSPKLKIKRNNEDRIRNQISLKNENYFKAVIEF